MNCVSTSYIFPSSTLICHQNPAKKVILFVLSWSTLSFFSLLSVNHQLNLKLHVVWPVLNLFLTSLLLLLRLPLVSAYVSFEKLRIQSLYSHLASQFFYALFSSQQVRGQSGVVGSRDSLPDLDAILQSISSHVMIMNCAALGEM